MPDDNAYETPKRKIELEKYYYPDFAGIGEFEPTCNSIVIYYGEEELSVKELSQIAGHEQKHQDNHLLGITNMPMSIEQNHRNGINNEISANIALLLSLREDYIQAKTDEERIQIVNSSAGRCYPFYFSAVQQGKIDPFSQNPEDFKKEMQFIAQGMQRHWMADSYPLYQFKQFKKHNKNYFNQHHYSDMAANEENYQKSKQIAYGTNLGGVDFTSYIDDEYIPLFTLKEADKKVAENKKRESVLETLEKDDNLLSYCNFEQAAIVNKASMINTSFSGIIKFRNSWVKQFYDNPEREETQKLVKELQNGEIRCVGDDEMIQEYVDAVVAGKIKPNPLGIDKEEEDFISQLIKKESDKICSLDSDQCATQFMQMKKDVSAEDSQKAFDFLIKQNLSFQGIDFRESFHPKCDQTLILMDEHVKSNSASDGTFKEKFSEWMPALDNQAKVSQSIPMSPLKFWAENPNDQVKIDNLWEKNNYKIYWGNSFDLPQKDGETIEVPYDEMQASEAYVYYIGEPKYYEGGEVLSLEICDLREPFLAERYNEMEIAQRKKAFNDKVDLYVQENQDVEKEDNAQETDQDLDKNNMTALLIQKARSRN